MESNDSSNQGHNQPLARQQSSAGQSGTNYSSNFNSNAANGAPYSAITIPTVDQYRGQNAAQQFTQQQLTHIQQLQQQAQNHIQAHLSSRGQQTRAPPHPTSTNPTANQQYNPYVNPPIVRSNAPPNQNQAGPSNLQVAIPQNTAPSGQRSGTIPTPMSAGGNNQQPGSRRSSAGNGTMVVHPHPTANRPQNQVAQPRSGIVAENVIPTVPRNIRLEPLKMAFEQTWLSVLGVQEQNDRDFHMVDYELANLRAQVDVLNKRDREKTQTIERLTKEINAGKERIQGLDMLKEEASRNLQEKSHAFVSERMEYLRQQTIQLETRIAESNDRERRAVEENQELKIRASVAEARVNDLQTMLQMFRRNGPPDREHSLRSDPMANEVLTPKTATNSATATPISGTPTASARAVPPSLQHSTSPEMAPPTPHSQAHRSSFTPQAEVRQTSVSSSSRASMPRLVPLEPLVNNKPKFTRPRNDSAPTSPSERRAGSQIDQDEPPSKRARIDGGTSEQQNDELAVAIVKSEPEMETEAERAEPEMEAESTGEVTYTVDDAETVVVTPERRDMMFSILFQRGEDGRLICRLCTENSYPQPDLPSDDDRQPHAIREHSHAWVLLAKAPEHQVIDMLNGN